MPVLSHGVPEKSFHVLLAAAKICYTDPKKGCKTPLGNPAP